MRGVCALKKLPLLSTMLYTNLAHGSYVTQNHSFLINSIEVYAETHIKQQVTVK